MAVEIKASIPSAAGRPHARGARLRRRPAPPVRTRAAPAARARAARQKRLDAGEAPDFLAATAEVREAEWQRGAGARRPRGPPRRDHRSGRAQDDDQRAQLRRARLHGRLRGRALAHLGQRDRRPANLSDAVRRTIAFDEPRRQALPAQRADRDAARAPARLAPGREARPRRRQPDLGQPVRLRPLLLPQRRGAHGARQPAPTSTCPSSRATSRRGSGTTSSTTRRTRSASRAAPSAPPS